MSAPADDGRLSLTDYCNQQIEALVTDAVAVCGEMISQGAPAPVAFARMVDVLLISAGSLQRTAALAGYAPPGNAPFEAAFARVLRLPAYRRDALPDGTLGPVQPIN